MYVGGTVWVSHLVGFCSSEYHICHYSRVGGGEVAPREGDTTNKQTIKTSPVGAIRDESEPKEKIQ